MKPSTKNNINIVSSILITFIILFFTSFLLDVEIIKTSTTRSIIIGLFMVVEMGFGVLILGYYLKK